MSDEYFSFSGESNCATVFSKNSPLFLMLHLGVALLFPVDSPAIKNPASYGDKWGL